MDLRFLLSCTAVTCNPLVCADAPRVSIKLGEPLELEMIEEGHDVYFTCLVDANPRPELVSWLYNVSTAAHTVARYK